MGFFSARKLRILLFLLSLLFILCLGPLIQIDPQARSQLPPKEKIAPLVQGAEESFYQPRGQATHPRNFRFAYLHGFSASRAEISPVVEDLADYYAAPTFFTRLTGHGIKDQGASFAEAHCVDWLRDADHAVEQARAKDRDLILIGTSFGALLSSFAALEHPSDIKALVLISPIFEYPHWIAKFISGPLGPFWARVLLGASHEFRTKNELHEKYWTTRYSTRVIPQLMDCVNYMRGQDFSKIKVPLLILYTERDDVVSVPAIKQRFQEFGSPKKFLVEVPGATDHVLTGQIINPQTLPFVEKRIEEFLDALP